MGAMTRIYRVVCSAVLLGLIFSPLQFSVAQKPEPPGQLSSLGLFRTRVAVQGPARWQRLEQLGVTALDRGDDWGLLLANEEQMEALARLGFRPLQADSLDSLLNAHGREKPWLVQGLQSQLDVVRAAHEHGEPVHLVLTAEQRAGLASLLSVDTDGDGLSDTQEQWWCTDPLNPNTDGDPYGYTDGQEVYALLDFTLPRNVRYGYGPPFGPPNPWPAWNQPGGCNDGDWDTIPDYAEAYMVGSRVTGETTDRDKFDDGQELFGITYCPGAPTTCGYGSYPRQEYWNFIQAEMPSWVLPPGDNLFVAGFPIPDVYVVPGSWTVERVTVITTEEGEIVETTHSYETSVTRGQSTSIANTVTWNEWEEVSEAVEAPIGPVERSPWGQPWQRSVTPRFNWRDLGFGAGHLAVGGLGISAAVAGECATTAGFTLGLGCVAALAAGAFHIVQGGFDIYDAFKADEVQNQVGPNEYPPQQLDVGFSPEQLALVLQNQNSNFQGLANSLDGLSYNLSRQGNVLARGLYDLSHAISQPRHTETRTNGRSWGGAQTTTHEEYEEHTVTEGEAFTSGRNWSTAWAVDSSHAADLTFDFVVQNSGTEYAREITGLIFNVYLGSDPNPVISYPAWEQFPGGSLQNVFPGDYFTFSSNAVPLTLDQMRRLDLGEPLTIVLEDYSYGADELFYQDAVNGGLTVFVEDGDETVDTYVVPTWGVETVQDVVQRYLPSSEDPEGNLASLWTPEFNGINPPVWNENYLSDISWWNIYQTCNISDPVDCANVGSMPLQEQEARAGGAILFRFNRDSDRDGYSDRVELQYGTDKDNPASHPQPGILAAYASSRQGNVVTVKLAVQNNGTFDAYGIDAVMYAPDATTTIGNNTVGGNGRIPPGGHVAVGSLVLPPGLGNWTASTAHVYTGGSCAGMQDKVYTFTVTTPGIVGQGSAAISWDDGAGNSGSLDLGGAYHAPLPVSAGAEGLLVGFDTGTIEASESFTVAALTPRDTFTYTVESEPYTPPVVAVSYSDPQGSHRFITPVEIASLGDDLSSYSGQMLDAAGLQIVASGPFDPDVGNTTTFVFNSPHPAPIEDAHLYVNFVASGTVVAELPYTFTLQPGPTLYTVTWSTDVFTQPYDPNLEYLMLAFWTDAGGNIIDSAGRPLPTLAADPLPQVAASSLAWDFGTVSQGQELQHTFSLANVGHTPLLVYLDAPAGVTAATAGIRSILPGDVAAIELTLDTADLPVGAYAAIAHLRTTDAQQPGLGIAISGNILALSEAALAYPRDALQPWDRYAYVPGPHTAGDVITFTQAISEDYERVHPLYVYSMTGELAGVGEYGPDFSGQTAPLAMFGDGRDGDLTVGSGQTIVINNVRVNVTASGTSASPANSNGFGVGDVVLFHQTQGTANVGLWEFGQIAAINSPTSWTLAKPLAYSYDSTNGKAQAIRVPRYRNITVQSSGTLTAPAWDGGTGGILVFQANGTVDVGGSIAMNGGSTSNQYGATGSGFWGGNGVGWGGGTDYSFQGEGTPGAGGKSTSANGNGGGGGMQTGAPDGSAGGGGGNGTPGGAGNGEHPGAGGNPAGSSDLVTMVFGGGGGGGIKEVGYVGAGGGAGGGLLVVFAREFQLTGSMNANGGDGASANGDIAPAGGGGAGGSILIRSQRATLGTNLVTSLHGHGGSFYAGHGGDGGDGRIRVEYCQSFAGSTDPPASTQQLNCYIIRKLADGSDQVEFTLPVSVTNYERYGLQFGERGQYAAAGDQLFRVRLEKREYATATLDLLLLELGVPTVTSALDVGADGSVEWTYTGVPTLPVILPSPNLAAGLNTYLHTLPDPYGSDVIVPISVSLDTSGDLFLTNLDLVRGPDVDAHIAADDISFDNPDPADGDLVHVLATVHNAGSAGSGPLVAAAVVSNTLVGSAFVATIPASGTAQLSIAWDTTGWGGDLTVEVRLDPYNRIAETDEGNNRASQPLHVRTRPDLQVTTIEATPLLLHNGEAATVIATVVNAGESDALASALQFYDGPPGDGTEFGAVTLTVPAGATITATVCWTAGPLGPHTLYAVADAGAAVREGDESNNQGEGDFYVGIGPEVYLDSGSSPDPVYSPTLGYGYLNGEPLAWGGGALPTETVRWNPDGNAGVQYRFDYMLLPAFYHLDLVLYEGDGAGRTETVWADGFDMGTAVTLTGGQVQCLSLLLDPALYADHAVTTSVRCSQLAGAVVSEEALREVQYVYLDSGPDAARDPAYSSLTGYGYLNGYGSQSWGTTPAETVRTIAGNEVRYRFDNLLPGRDYQLNLTLYEEDGAGRVETVWIDDFDTGCSVSLGDGLVHEDSLSVPIWTYIGDGTVTVAIRRTNGNFVVVSEIALEQHTLPCAVLGDDDDSLGPAITSVAAPGQAGIGEGIHVQAQVSDSARGNHGVSSAALYYGYAAPYNQNTIAGTGPGGNGDGPWSFVIPAQGAGHSGQTLRFFLLAVDGDDTPAWTVDDNEGTYYGILLGSGWSVYLPLVMRQ